MNKQGSINWWKISTIVLGIIAFMGLLWIYAESDHKEGSEVNEEGESVFSLDITGEPGLGNPEAPVTVIEYTDFQCPYCSLFHSRDFPRLEEEYINTGKVFFVIKDFPITSIHRLAGDAHILMNCVAQQDELYYWEVLEDVYDLQETWSREVDSKLLQAFILQNENINEEELESCFNGLENRKVMEDEILQDIKEASDVVRGTPNFFINGIRIAGLTSYEKFSQIIDSEIEKSNQ